MACCDIYQALTEDRPYKDAMSHEKSIEIMRSMAVGNKIDSQIVEDMNKPFNTVEKEDSSMYTGQTKVQTEGVNGTQRVTEKVKYVNGEAQPVVSIFFCVLFL